MGTMLEDAGPPRPPSQDVDESAILNASQGLIPKMGGDAVRKGRVYGVSDDLWMFGIGPAAAAGVVDDLEKHPAEG